AGGSVHVYGTLRGRVFAGASGFDKARIFCRIFEAELLAVDDPRLPTLLEQQRQLRDSRRRALRLELDGLAETV
ncbi:septum site-determining protein MinC, partial [Klebsiella pneumoniae]|uniref:septum site-determining protein MinC n=1 Tax=Klebsiella pneumoniae TaxID=573 RepID=UPI001D0DEA73